VTQVVSIAQVVTLIAERGAAGRSLTALAGPPGAGKSTAALAIQRALNDMDPESAAILQMDGYHFDNRVLEQRGLRDRKGAPQTFDVGGLAAMLLRLRQNREAEIAVPVFDRSIEIARAGAGVIPSTARHILVEGNYLLLDQAPWNSLHAAFDTTVFVTADIPLLRRRLEARWEGGRLTRSQIAAKVEGNDLENANLVLNNSRAAEFALSAPKRRR
jgi:pantothenate kinase